ncbi:zinc dependent phospholipase C family protein [Paucisalibacillus sp. EB02]|uniref:zinc dependent phospholipase C family protein n=1 Tax=Paucisalibacillus sp. EB02 TaxID=1347087 RepID=UPI0005A9F3FF|nr:zinc dependent phospholipase C family protein [Paucisalibacillus sp. EB02]
MPNIWTHMLFCEDVVDTIGISMSIPKHSYILNLGAQGPDPFFYFNFWPWIEDGPVNHIGNLLHNEKCGEFLMDLIDEVKDQSNEMKSYVFGFVTHHILDRNTHPYIHYRAGYEGNKHSKLEIIIDTLMMERYKNLKTWKTPVYKEIHLNRRIKHEIAGLLYRTIKKHFPVVEQNSPKNIIKAFNDMKLALKLLADPNGWKNKLLRSTVSSFSHQPIVDHTDFLNMERTTWYHSATREPSTKSFIDLYEQARIESIDIMKKVLEYWSKDESNREDLVKVLGEISYDTGLPLQLKKQNRYSDPII